jgi:hypothetical protein
MYSGVLASVFLLMAAGCPAQMGNLRAGAAKVDVTPSKEMFPVKASAQFGDIEKAHDPIYARALVMDNGKTKLAIVGVDVLDWQIDGLREEIAAALQIPQENVILNPTHDDSSLHAMSPRPGGDGKIVDEAAIANMKKGMIEAAREADANLQPARVGYGTGKVDVNINRSDRDGLSDKTVTVMVLTKPSGEPIAIYTAYAVHSIVMYQSLMENGKMQMTSDLAGWTEKFVEAHFPGAVAMWAVAAGGDQAPRYTSKSGLSYREDDPYDLGTTGWTLLDMQSRRLGAEIVRVTKMAVQDTSGQAVLWATRSSVTCPAPQRVQQAVGQGQAAQGQSPPNAPANATMTIPLQLMMVNDIAIAGVNGDPATEIGLQFRQESLFERNMLVTMIPNMIGHLQSDKQGCTNRAMDQEFQKMMKSYLPVWNVAQ